MLQYIVLVIALICSAIAGPVGNEDEIISPDMGITTDSQAIGDFMQPGIINIGVSVDNGRERYDIDGEPVQNHKHKKSKNLRSERIRNHQSRHMHSNGEESLGEETETETAMKQVDVRSMNWKVESLLLVRRCNRGIDSPVWNETSCISCKCEAAEVQCERPMCPKLECDQLVQVDGECCPRCPEKLCETPDGRRFKHGKEWHMDDCTFCECNKGNILCSVEDCRVPRCKNPIKVPGRCCPICLDSSCHASNGTKIIAEQVWKEGVCTHCYCSGGEKKCDEERCPYINCTSKHIPEGKCCEVCDDGVVDCVVSEWGRWSECVVQECGGGMSKRFRTSIIPARNGGQFCPHKSQAKLCPRIPCDVLPVCPVTEWTAWGHCTATCGNGRQMRSRKRERTDVASMTSLIDCSTTSFEETKECYAGACVPIEEQTGNRDSLVHGDFCFNVTWSEWSPCPSGCGSGVQQREQVLINESHPLGHLCHLLKQVRKCVCDSIQPQNSIAVKCLVSPWGDWSSCSKTCGPNGFKTKERRIIQHASGGAPCLKKLLVKKPCRNRPCEQRTESSYSSDFCITEHDEIKRHGEEWIENSCATCSCIRSEIRCTACEP